ncbi:MAG TPA: poly-gamma-glutamate biosynthesis protein PgsC [Caldithrix sp.]|nr:poly-gamma-glutamate biosynthesis protein PgsC [Caldithrix sp.]
MILTAFGLAIVIGFIFFEISGLTAGGIIAPGYLALYLDEPLRILVTLLISTLTYGVVLLLSRFTILFGRRRFLLMILIGFLLRAAFDGLQVYLPETGFDLQAIGYIVPGLIANEFYRQGIGKTIMAIVIVTVPVFLILQIWYY